MDRVQRAAVTAGLGFAYLLLLVSALIPLAILFLAAAVAAVAMELVLSRRAPHLLPEVLNSGLGVRFRLLSLDVLTALLAARLLPDAGGLVALAVVAVLLLAAGRDIAGVFGRRLRWRLAGGPVSWRNLDVAGLPVPRPTAVVPELDLPFTLLTLLIPLGYAVGSVADRFGAAIVAQWLVVGVVVLFLAGRLVQYLVLNRPDEEVREAVRAAIERAAPQVVLHHAGRRGTVDQVLLWLPALRALERPCLVVVREPSQLEALDGCGVPAVWAPRSQDVELFMVASVDLALYPSSATNINNHLLRVPGIYDVLVGHGDSDEPESSSPLARMYDEIWVAGALGQQRYAYPVSGVPAGKVKQIGPVRPPAPVQRPVAERPVAERSAVARSVAERSVAERPAVARPTVARPVAERSTVVYAPTWENVADVADLDSLLPHGAEIVEALLARQDVRVLFVPAAATGARVPAARIIADRLRRRIAAEGGDHATWGAERLREALAVASFAVVDVSPALAETVRADVPFAVPAVRELDAAAMGAAYPTTAAGFVLHAYPADVFAALDDALGPDTHAPARLALGRSLDASGDFPARFRAAVDEAITAQRRRRAFARPAAPPSAAPSAAPAAAPSARATRSG